MRCRLRVTEDHLADGRRQILDGARRCFAEYGYDKPTVRRLEQTIGLPHKEVRPVRSTDP